MQNFKPNFKRNILCRFLNLPRIRGKEQMKVKEEQNFKLRTSGTPNRKKHEQVNTQFVNSTIMGCNA